MDQMAGVPMVIGDKELAAIDSLKKKAESNVVPYDLMLKLATGQMPIPANWNHDMTIFIPLFYEVTYTHEEHKPGLVLRHMSVSCKNRDRVPNEHAIALLMEKFGFVNKLGNVVIRKEQLKVGIAIEILDPVNG